LLIFTVATITKRRANLLIKNFFAYFFGRLAVGARGESSACFADPVPLRPKGCLSREGIVRETGPNRLDAPIWSDRVRTGFGQGVY